MSRCTSMVDGAKSISASTNSEWGSLPWIGIDGLAGRLRPVNPWQEAWEVVSRRERYHSSLGTWRGGHVGSRAGRSAAGTSSRFQTAKSFSAREGHWSKLPVEPGRAPDNIMVAEQVKEESSRNPLFPNFRNRFRLSPGGYYLPVS